MNILSLFSFSAFWIYLYLGFYTIRLDHRSRLNWIFSSLCLVFAVWAFSYTFFYSAPDKESVWFWYRISSIGWSSFPAIFMHYSLVLTEREKTSDRPLVYPFLYLPALTYIYKGSTGTLLVKDFVYQGLGWCEVAASDSIWFWSYVVYYSGFILGSLFLVLHWGQKTESLRKKKQAKIILATSIPTLIGSAVTDTILPALDLYIMPSVAVILILGWIFGIWYSISRHKLMSLTPSIAADEIVFRMVGMLVLVDPEGRIIKVNRQVKELLGYENDEIIGRPFSNIVVEGDLVDEALAKLKKNPDQTVVYELVYKGENNMEVPVSVSFSAASDKYGEMLGTVVVGRDIRQMKQLQQEIKERRRMEETITYQAYHDALTGLSNRVLFNDRLALSLAQAHRDKRMLAVIFLDLDNFKSINDSMGHSGGDQVLQSTANLLRNIFRESDLVARMGGDEYAILLPNILHEEDVSRVAHKILSAFRQLVVISGHKLHISTSIGISIYPRDGESPEMLLKNADTAMYHSKELGGNNYQFYNDAINIRALDQVMSGSRLLHAIEHGELALCYQPQIDINTGEVVSVESLVRWKHPELGMLYPRQFLHVAEKTGLMPPLGEWVLKTACIQNKAWQEAGLLSVPVTVNFSVLQLQQPNIMEVVRDILNLSSLKPEFLVFEITENLAMLDMEATISNLQKLNETGIQFSIDNFGIGYSSLDYLKKFPIQAVKIDRSFIGNVTTYPDDATIVSAVISLAKSLNLKTIAEGVETDEQVVFLKACGCDVVQGYLISPAVLSHEMENLMNKRFLH
ncbi:MAG: EAL domain-containing protein [Thermodesulfovibrionales bacterium]|nr:EAL domain-containing protein [Thermodesulfovibrionales bacterium]